MQDAEASDSRREKTTLGASLHRHACAQKAVVRGFILPVWFSYFLRPSILVVVCHPVVVTLPSYHSETDFYRCIHCVVDDVCVVRSLSIS
jgi:hypothetical protein